MEVPSPYRPGAHCPEHVGEDSPLDAPKYPQLQGLWVADWEPATQKKPALHWPLQEAVVRPLEDPKVPAGQLGQEEAPAPLYVPGLQSVQVLAPLAENLPAAQAPHTELPQF